MVTFSCLNCNRAFETDKGRKIHLSRCQRTLSVPHTYSSSNIPTENNTFDFNGKIEPLYPAVELFPNVNTEKADFIKDVIQCYEEIVHYRRNLFKVPSGKAGKQFIVELSFWIRQFNVASNINSVSLKTFMILPALLLQKPSAKSKAKQHSECLSRRLALWKNGEVIELLKESRLIQKRLQSSRKSKSIDDVSRIFAKLIMEGKISAALKILDSESSSGVLPISDQVLNDLKLKHPNSEPASEECLLFGPLEHIPSYFYESIDEQTVMQSALKTKGSAGPSGMDAELYRRILCSKNFSAESKLLREEIATFAIKLLSNSYDPALIEPYVASRLIPLDKNPGVRPIGVGEVLRRIVGKMVSTHAKSEIRNAAGPLQACSSQGAGAEAAIHAMRQCFELESTDAVLLIDASNAFNCMNRAVALHNISILCPVISLYIINTYRHPSRLFIAGGGEISSMEGTTQGDPLAMPWYSINTVMIINSLRAQLPNVTQVWLADDAASGEKLLPLYDWYNLLIKEGKKYGYLVNCPKSWLIVKSPELAEQAKHIFGTSVNITEDGKRHLGSVIGSKAYKQEYCEGIVENWVNQLKVLCEIANTQPQAAYCAYTKGFRSKFTYFLRTIDNFEEFVTPIDTLIENDFLPTLFGQDTPLENYHRKIFAQAPGDGGLGVPILSEEAVSQFQASSLASKIHVESILEQRTQVKDVTTDGETLENLENVAASTKRERKIREQQNILENVPEDLKPFLEQAKDKGASSWLNAIPLTEQDLDLNKEEFRDALCLRYNFPLPDLPSFCACGDRFTVKHALTCAKGGFISQRHNSLRDFFTILLNKVCVDVEHEPHLLPVNNEHFDLRTSNTKNDARLDLKARGFWRRGQTAFFDVRVTHVNSDTNKNKNTKKIFREHEEAKKREYMQRVLEVEHASFTPLIFGSNGGMGEEGQRFVSALSNKLAFKQNEKYSDIITWLRVRLSVHIIKSTLLCVRGSRTPFRLNSNNNLAEDFRLANVEAGIV